MPMVVYGSPEFFITKHPLTSLPPRSGSASLALGLSAASEPMLRPESSLGGSARELLNADGRLRQP